MDAATTRALVRGMLIEGFTFAELARRLGITCERFQVHSDQVTVRTYLAVRALYRRVM